MPESFRHFWADIQAHFLSGTLFQVHLEIVSESPNLCFKHFSRMARKTESRKFLWRVLPCVCASKINMWTYLGVWTNRSQKWAVSRIDPVLIAQAGNYFVEYIRISTTYKIQSYGIFGFSVVLLWIAGRNVPTLRISLPLVFREESSLISGGHLRVGIL